MRLNGPIAATAWKLTGEAQHRTSWNYKLVLQVREERAVGYARPPSGRNARQIETRWRDATERDLAKVQHLFGLQDESPKT